MTHAPVAAAQRYTHGWVPIGQQAPPDKTPAHKAAPAPAPAPKTAATDRAAQRAADRAAKAAKAKADRVSALKSKLHAAQSRRQARAAVAGQKLEDLQALAAEMKLSTEGSQSALVERLVNHVMPSLLAAAAGVPYANTEATHYADPGYQADGKKRYALDSEQECRAAWSYINMPRNAAKYSPENLAKVKAAIKAAGAKYGIQFADEVRAAAPMVGVELARPGTWHLSTGKRTFTAQNLQDAADFYAASGQAKIPLGFGHTDPRFDGDPAFGWVSNIRYSTDAKGPVLLGDLVDMDDWLAAAAPKRWPNRSIEGFVNLDFGGRTYSLALTRLALLGSTPPAMPTIRSLSDLKDVVAAAAAQGCEFIAASLLSTSDTHDPASRTRARAVARTRKEKPGMDPAQFLEELGLSDDFSPDEVMEALAKAGFAPAPADAPPNPAPTPVAAGAPTEGTMTVATSLWQEQQATIERLTAFIAKYEREQRDQVLAKAVSDGKFTPAQRPHFAKLWDADPHGTRALVDNLARNSALAVAASGYATEDETAEFEREYNAFFGTSTAGGRRG